MYISHVSWLYSETPGYKQAATAALDVFMMKQALLLLGVWTCWESLIAALLPFDRELASFRNISTLRVHSGALGYIKLSPQTRIQSWIWNGP